MTDAKAFILDTLGLVSIWAGCYGLFLKGTKMKWETIKSAEQIKLSGVTVGLDYCDRSLKNVVIRDKDGNALRVGMESYSMTASVPAAPETKKVWRLHGEYRGLKVNETFEYEHEAQQRHRDLESTSGLEITNDEIEVKATTSTAPAQEDLVPF